MEDLHSQSQQFLAILQVLDSIPFAALILLAFAATLVENLFPPSPSDVIFAATAVLIGRAGDLLFPLIIAGAAGATAGFWIMYWIGFKFDKKIIEADRIKFISKETIEKVDRLFQRWGMKLVIINRFVSGTRAVISFFAGMSALDRRKTLLYAGVSSLTYYGLLGAAGYYFGKDWHTLLHYFHIYKEVTLAVSAVVVVAAVAIWLYRKIRSRKVKDNS